MKDLIVIMSKKGKQKRGDQIKTTIDRSAVVTPLAFKSIDLDHSTTMSPLK